MNGAIRTAPQIGHQRDFQLAIAVKIRRAIGQKAIGQRAHFRKAILRHAKRNIINCLRRMHRADIVFPIGQNIKCHSPCWQRVGQHNAVLILHQTAVKRIKIRARAIRNPPVCALIGSPATFKNPTVARQHIATPESHNHRRGFFNRNAHAIFHHRAICQICLEPQNRSRICHIRHIPPVADISNGRPLREVHPHIRVVPQTVRQAIPRDLRARNKRANIKRRILPLVICGRLNRNRQRIERTQTRCKAFSTHAPAAVIIVVPRCPQINCRRNEQAAHRLRRQIGPPRENQRGQTGDVRRRKRRTRAHRIAVVEPRTKNTHAWRHQIKRCPPAAKIRPIVGMISRANGNRMVIARGIPHLTARISRRRHEHNALRVRVLDRIAQEKRALRPSPAHIDHMRAIFYGIENSRCEIVFLQKTTALKPAQPRPQCHDLCIGRNPDNSPIVISHRSNNARGVCPVRRFIARIIVADEIIAQTRHTGRVRKIPAPHIVDIPIVIVVNPLCATHFCGIVPDIIAQILVIIIHARIDNRHNNLFFHGTYRPVQCFPTQRLKTALIVITRIIGHLVMRKQKIGLRVHNIGARCIIARRFDWIARQTHAVHPRHRMGINRLTPSMRKKRLHRRHAIAF